jgi:hypothetical protein
MQIRVSGGRLSEVVPRLESAGHLCQSIIGQESSKYAPNISGGMTLPFAPLGRV